MAVNLRKMLGADNPLLDTVKNLFYCKQHSMQPWGLIIILLSKSVKHETESRRNVIFQKQRTLAEVTEMTRTGHIIHKGLVDPNDKNVSKELAAFSNKMGLLAGDYFLATAKLNLSKIRNQELEGIMSSALRDLIEGEFFGPRDLQNHPLPGRPINGDEESFEISLETGPIKIYNTIGLARKEWTVRNMMGGATLLGRGCQGSMVLAGQPTEIQRAAYLFGCHLNLAWQAANELQMMTSNDDERFSLVSAPVLFALQENMSIYSAIEGAKSRVVDVDFDALKSLIFQTNALKRTRQLLDEHSLKAIDFVDSLGCNKSIDTIKNIIMAI